jgi:hypothetical protein
MTELTEQQQRTLYEWLRPELKGKDWVLRDIGPLGGKQAHTKPVFGQVMAYLPPLDYNTFMGEAVPKLAKEKVAVSFSYDSWWFNDRHWPPTFESICNADPWLALVEYLEGK